MGWIIFGIFLGIVAVVANFVVTAFINDGNRYEISKGTAKKLTVKPALLVLSFLLPVALMTGIASTTRVGTGEIAVMTQFGRVTGQELGEGFHVKNPFDVAHKYDIKNIKIDAEAASASKDLQDVKTSVVVNYYLEAGKVSEIHRTVGELYREKLVDNNIQASVKAATADYNATQLITNRDEAQANAYNRLKNKLDDYGIVVKELNFTNIQFSPEFTKAIEAKQVAEQDAQRAVFIAQKAQQEAQAEIERARGQAESQRLLTETASAESIELKKLEVQSKAIDKWNGALPTTQLGEGTQFLLQR